MKETAAAATRGRAFRRVVDVARRAPSVHNTQPWTWTIHDDALELHADRTRGLEAADPDGRNLLMSCGTALHHALVAARALGWAPVVDTLPDPRDPDLLARVRLRPAAIPTDAAESLEAIKVRCTDRRRFTSWPIPDARLRRLATATRSLGATAVPILDLWRRRPLERLVDRAMEILGDEIPDHLKLAGTLRLEHKQASLEELGQLHDPVLTKDAIAGRIRRLLAMADKRAQDLGVPDTEASLTPEMLAEEA